MFTTSQQIRCDHYDHWDNMSTLTPIIHQHHQPGLPCAHFPVRNFNVAQNKQRPKDLEEPQKAHSYVMIECRCCSCCCCCSVMMMMMMRRRRLSDDASDDDDDGDDDDDDDDDAINTLRQGFWQYVLLFRHKKRLRSIIIHNKFFTPPLWACRWQWHAENKVSIPQQAPDLPAVIVD